MVNPLSYVDALQARDVSFTSFRNALKNHELPVSTGWQQTIEKIIPGLKSAKTKSLYESALIKIHDDLTLYCDKAVRVYDVEKDVLSALLKQMVKKFVSVGTDYSKDFPFPLSVEDLVNAGLNVVCVEQWDEGGRINFMLCSKQYVTIREALSGEMLGEDALKEFGVFDELIGVRRKPVQLYDIITLIPEQGVIEVRLDGVKKFNADDISKRLRNIERLISQFAKRNLAHEGILKSSINFYPAIRKLYDSNDGVVGELGHVTDATGVFREKMRHKSKDVRKDPYHHGGTEAVVDLNAYSISKHWVSPLGNGNPEVSIPAHFSIASNPNPTVDMLHVLSCTSQEDYDFVLSKVL